MTTNTETVVPGKQAGEKRYSFWTDLFRRLIREKPLGTFGLVVVVILFLTGIFATWLAPYPMNQVHLLDRLQPPSIHYLLGTDQLGRDELSRIIYGARISMLIGVIGTVIHSLVAIIIGVISGYFGGKTDMFIQRFVDVWISIPPLLILMTLMSIVGNGMFQIIVILGITTGIAASRIIRSAVFSIKSNMYISSADVIGCSPVRTIMRHIMPNIMAPIIIDFTISMGGIIMMEAMLSFLGYGMPVDVPSWGSMLSLEGRANIQNAPMLAIWPGLALTIVVFGINMFGDALRDLLDPRLRRGVGRYNFRAGKLKKA